MRTPIAIPDLSGNEQKYVADAIASTWISSTGEYIDKFEREFARLCAVDYAIAVANGTVALHLALLATGVGPGDEVILPSLTYISTANAVKYVGASPVFVDVDPSWCMDPREVKKAITDRTRAIIAVHLYGNVCDMDELDAIATRNKLWLIEDAAEAPFATYYGSPTGGLGDIATFSFYGNKIITCGEGGAITTNDETLAQRIRQLRGQGMDPERRYFFPVVGYNYRLTNVACAILCAQLERVDEMLARRREIVNRYKNNLEPVLVRQQSVEDYVTPSPWLFSIATPFRKQIVNALTREGVETRPFFEPIHTLPPYVNDKVHGQMMYTLELASSGFNLPTYPGLADDEVDRICAIIERAR